MKKLLSRIAEKLIPGISVMKENFYILAFKHGQWRSAREGMAIDALGTALPWYTYPAIEYLNNFDFKDCNVFEFGSGNSSLYWSSRARSVISVEDNPEWFEVVNKRKLQNQLIIHRADGAGYVRALPEQNKLFEIIVIDGNWRFECTVEAINCLKENGIIVLDNSERKIERECGKLLRENGFVQIDFSGFGPINGYCWSTSLFIKNINILQRNFNGPSPIGGVNYAKNN